MTPRTSYASVSAFTVELATPIQMRAAQQLVTEHHYLHAPVDPRCSPLTYVVRVAGLMRGVLIFGRPEATRVNGWYGGVEDVAAGRCRLTRWEVINLARVWLDPSVQRGGSLYVPNLVTQAIAAALRRVVVDYLVVRPPCFPEEPWMLREVLSYCDTSKHLGTIYQASNFHLVRENERGIQTWARPLRHLTHEEQRLVLRASATSERSRRYRSMRAAVVQQPVLIGGTP